MKTTRKTRKSRSVHLLAGELITFYNTNVLGYELGYAYVLNNFSTKNKPYSVIPVIVMPVSLTDDVGHKTGMYVKDIVDRLGITTMQEYMHENPERFI